MKHIKDLAANPDKYDYLPRELKRIVAFTDEYKKHEASRTDSEAGKGATGKGKGKVFTRNNKEEHLKLSAKIDAERKAKQGASEARQAAKRAAVAKAAKSKSKELGKAGSGKGTGTAKKDATTIDDDDSSWCEELEEALRCEALEEASNEDTEIEGAESELGGVEDEEVDCPSSDGDYNTGLPDGIDDLPIGRNPFSFRDPFGESAPKTPTGQPASSAAPDLEEISDEVGGGAREGQSSGDECQNPFLAACPCPECTGVINLEEEEDAPPLEPTRPCVARTRKRSKSHVSEDESEEARRAPIANPKKGAQKTRAEPKGKKARGISKGSQMADVVLPDEPDLVGPFEKGVRHPSAKRNAENYIQQSATGPGKRYS